MKQKYESTKEEKKVKSVDIQYSIWNTEFDIIFPPSKTKYRDFTLLGIIVIAIIKRRHREEKKPATPFLLLPKGIVDIWNDSESCIVI